MWKFLFEVGDFFCRFIPGRKNREWIRRTQLYDYRKKLNCLKQACPDLNFKNTKLVKGGWNIGFIVDNKYVFKIRKAYDDSSAVAKIIREKRITDAFAKIVNVQIPKIEIIETSEYTFYRYGFIPGVNLNNMDLKNIARNKISLGKTLGKFIYSMHNADPKSIKDLKIPSSKNSDGWNHHDICNNIIVNPETMEIVGIIDWEYAGYGPLKTEFINTIAFNDRMKKSGIIIEVMTEYYNLRDKETKKG